MWMVSAGVLVLNVMLFYRAGRAEGDPWTCLAVGILATLAWAFVWPFHWAIGLVVIDALGFGAVAGIRILREKAGRGRDGP
jgi:hypothetical protein